MSKPSTATTNAILTVEELAKYLRLNRTSVYDAIHTGKMPGARRFGRTRRISLDAVLKWMARGERIARPAERVSISQI